jgi:hypothetical protein
MPSFKDWHELTNTKKLKIIKKNLYLFIS